MTISALTSGLTRRACALAVAAVVALVSGCTGGGPTPAPTTSDAGAVSGSPAPRSTGGSINVRAYYAADTGTDLKLVREYRPMSDAGGWRLTAARAVLAGQPLDPDYRGLWNPLGEVLGVREANGAFVVDLSKAATTTTTGSVGGALAVQALVYAVTDSVNDSDPGFAPTEAYPVRILVEGEIVDELFGVVDTSEPITRADQFEVRQLVQITWPNEGDTDSTKVTVMGDAAVFEATLPWRVTTPDGVEVRTGVAHTIEGQRFSPFSFDVTLEPGNYVVTVTEDDPSDGEGGPVATDTRMVVVE